MRPEWGERSFLKMVKISDTRTTRKTKITKTRSARESTVVRKFEFKALALVKRWGVEVAHEVGCGVGRKELVGEKVGSRVRDGLNVPVGACVGTEEGRRAPAAGAFAWHTGMATSHASTAFHGAIPERKRQINKRFSRGARTEGKEFVSSVMINTCAWCVEILPPL